MKASRNNLCCVCGATAERLCQSCLRAILRYNKATGHFRWRGVGTKAQQRLKGRLAGSTNVAGYRVIYIGGFWLYAHRLAWLYVHGKWPNPWIDHKNRNTGDNRFCNLREATVAENIRNRGLRRNKTSPHGTYYVGRVNRWIAAICVNRKKFHLGYFDTPEEARAVYCAAAKKYHGKFASVR